MTVSFGRIDLRFVPVKAWPGPRTRVRRASPFRASWSSTQTLLRKELDALNARDILLQTFHTENQIRQDGMPYANARVPDDPGVILTFESRVGSLSFPCDSFQNWQDNVRAIALAMEALRKVDRYGVTKRGEQYTGWKALPGPGGSTTTMTAEAAAKMIASISGFRPSSVLLSGPGLFREQYRAAARRAHPDAGGSVEQFQQLQVAKQVLENHHST